MSMRKRRFALLIASGALLVILSAAVLYWMQPPRRMRFSGEQAYQDVLTQMAFGPRIPGSAAHTQAVNWMLAELRKAGWKAEIQNTQSMDHPIQNVIAWRSEKPAQIILGAHYDSRLVADQDRGGSPGGPVPGANDGASGVAVLLELARTLPDSIPPTELVFFDAEDNGDLPGWDWLLGSRAFVESLSYKPRAAIIVDMIGDKNLDIYIEKNSTSELVQEIWSQAQKMGYSSEFISRPKYSMLDDHTPFLEAGIPAVDIIDFDYPYWHTSQDTADKVSAQSLLVVGDTLWHWLAAQPQ